MRDAFGSIQFWAYALLVVAFAPLAAFLGGLCHWPPGTAGLLLLCVPVTLAGLTGMRSSAILIVLLAVGGLFFEALVAALHRPDEVASLLEWVTLPVLGSGLLAFLAGMSLSVVVPFRKRIEALVSQNHHYVQDLYRREKAEAARAVLAGEGSVPPGPNHAADLQIPAATTSSGSPVQFHETSVNFPLLLLTLQDVGRKIATSLDFETLIPTIVGTAKSSLGCKHCQVYLWNSREQTLCNPLPPRERDGELYVPQASAGMARWVIEQRQILTRAAIANDYALQALLHEESVMPDAMAPLSVGGELLGLLIVDGIEQDSATFTRMLHIIANMSALAVKNAQLFKRIEDMAKRDGLTGLLNHASFQSEADELVQHSLAKERPLSVIMCDVDHFKKFNDTHGHQAGDLVLREVARLWKAVLPNYAVLARYGGEEFICALPGDDLDYGRHFAELLRETTHSNAVDFNGEPLQVTASFGVAELRNPAETAAELIRSADEALYKAKRAGRNRVVCASAAMTETRLFSQEAD